MKTQTALTALLVLTVAVTGASAAAAGPKAWLQGIDEKLAPLVANAKGNETRILGILNGMVDFETLCRDALGKHWKDRTAAEQQDFTTTLHKIIEKNIVKRLESSRSHEITYGAETIKGTEATVVTSVKAGKGPRAPETEIAYALRQKAGRWVVVDIITDGVSLVANYRSQFNKIIVEKGFPELMRTMRDKLAQP